MTTVIVYTTAHCSYCNFAKKLLDAKKVAYQEIRIDLSEDKRIEMEQLSGRRSVPQIIINGKAIGGFDDLAALDKSGQLDPLLQT